MKKQDPNELEHLITASYLKDAQKRELLLLLRREGQTEIFFQRFNELLMEEISSREQQFTQSIARFEEEETGISREIQRKRSDLEEQVARELATIDPADFTKKETIWDEYYASIEQLEKEYETQVKSIVSSITKSAMQR